MIELTPRQRLSRLVRSGEARMDLAEAALAVAQEEYPLLAPGPYLRRLDDMARRVESHLSNRRSPEDCIGALNRVLFDEEGFAGNQDDYYDPRNSFLNEVLDRRTGIPISLCVVYMETARRAGLPMVGVGLPGHFIVQYLTLESDTAGRKRYLVDPFHGGALLSEEDCRARVQRIYGGRMPFRDDYLKPVSKKSLLGRMLYNLKNIYVESKSYAKALAVIEKLIIVSPESWEEVRDRGIVFYHLKRYRAALADLENYLTNVPRAEDRAELIRLAKIISKSIQKRR